MSSPFSAVLLAGGQSRRMGKDKAFIELDGMPLWRRQLDILEQLGPRELFIAGPQHHAWLDANCAVIPDAQPDAGPLAGIVAALRRCSAPLLLALGVDLPHMTADYLRELVACCSDGRGAIPCNRRRFEPVAAVYPASALGTAESCLASGDHSLQSFAARCVGEGLVTPEEVTAEDEALFLNMNTPEDLLAVTNG